MRLVNKVLTYPQGPNSGSCLPYNQLGEPIAGNVRCWGKTVEVSDGQSHARDSRQTRLLSRDPNREGSYEPITFVLYL
jgi:hypothetical protein